MKKLLKDLTQEEVLQLLNVNRKFREMVTDYATDGANLQAGEILKPFERVRGINYSLSVYGYSYFEVGMIAFKTFLNGCMEISKNYGTFNESQVVRLERALTRVDFYDDCLTGYIDISETQFDKLDTWLTGIVDDLRETIKDEVIKIYAYADNEENLQEYAEIVADHYGEEYETDQIYLYEIDVRKYA